MLEPQKCNCNGSAAVIIIGFNPADGGTFSSRSARSVEVFDADVLPV